MFESLIDNLNQDSWQEIQYNEKNEEEFKEYHVMRNHVVVDATTIHYLIAEEDGDPKSVEIHDCVANKDPLKEIGLIEVKLNADETQIIGIDLNGDIVMRKG